MKHEPPRQPGVSVHFHSSKHYGDWLMQESFRRAAELVTGRIDSAPPESIVQVCGHLAQCHLDHVNGVGGGFDYEGAKRALTTFFKMER